MRKMRSILALLLVAVLLAAALPFASAATPDCMDEDELRTLLNRVELRPQKTHYARMDALLERLTAPYDGLDNYDRLREAYDWVVMNVEYSWEPYSQDWAPAYDCFDVDCGLELDAGAAETMPYEVVNRAYYALTERKGVCYDYAALFAVIARYIGFESFVRTGEFIFETMFGTGHHGWTSIFIDGREYVFDPQRDYRICFDATQPDKFYYFGVDEEHAWRYNPEECNDARDAGFAKPGTDFGLSELVQRMLPLVQTVPTEPHEVPIGA